MQRSAFTTFVDLPVGENIPNEKLPMVFADIERRTGGIRSRNVAGVHENIGVIGQAVLNELYDRLGIKGKDCGGLVLATTSAFELDGKKEVTKFAKGIAQRGGIRSEDVIGVNYACSSFPKAVQIARNLSQETDKHIPVICAEALTRKFIDWSDEHTAMLFGDRGAGTTIAPDGEHEILLAKAFEKEDPQHLIKLEQTNNWMNVQGEMRGERKMRVAMNGKPLFKCAPDDMIRMAREDLQALGLPLDDVVFFQHQANGRFAELMQKRIAADGSEWGSNTQVVNSMEFGNTLSCSIPSALARHLHEYAEGVTVVCPAKGAGADVRTGYLTEGDVVFKKGRT